MTLWRLAQAMRDLQRHRILWALLGKVAPDESLVDYWARLPR